MKLDKNTPRLLGLVQLIVFSASILSNLLLTSVVGSGNISSILVNISNNITMMRISIIVELITSIGIIFLAVMFYIVFYKKYKIISLIALGCFFTEAIILAISKIGAFALIPLSIKFAEAGFPESSYFQTLGDLLYYGIDRQLYHIHMLFFILGGILWYYLFYKTRYIPRIISVWGLLAVGLISINVLLVLYNRDFGSIIILFLPYMPFELFLGVWLIVKGFNSSAIRATKTEITQA
ncbi:MAG: DUF4386 domain-containing protein [Bacteroidetes bacterium]|nr:DUF4386 domain-containing protein [Bacteroidota bacterium]MBT4410675.1 DUF4386 domain-containing protein [Bacteroidota bacterium]MBT6046675.1 DUF4386 domain-containing protein [Candidatus Scalindua sp.]MBT7464264.1 DUF4386 domain-containing protein [Bacteroidota bacterium]MBT7827193.1 DUF4386 domain-containing protein [Bacteroidota bacterium]